MGFDCGELSFERPFRRGKGPGIAIAPPAREGANGVPKDNRSNEDRECLPFFGPEGTEGVVSLQEGESDGKVETPRPRGVPDFVNERSGDVEDKRIPMGQFEAKERGRLASFEGD